MKCPQCDGFGKVAGGPKGNGHTWRQYSFKPHNEFPELRDGSVEPITCPACKGAKQVAEPEPASGVDTPGKVTLAPKKPSKHS